MRILAVVDRAWPCDHSFLEEVLAKRLPQRGHEVRFVMPAAEPRHVGEHSWYGATVVASGGSGLRGELARIGTVRRQRTTFRPDVIYAYNVAAPAADACRRGTEPVVFQLSHFKEETLLLMNRRGDFRLTRELKARAHRRLRRCVMKRVDLVLPISDAMREVLVDSGERQAGMVIMPMGAEAPQRVGATKINELRDHLGVGDEGALVLYLGTLNRLRGLGLLVEAFARFREMHPGSIFAVLGRGPGADDRHILEAAAARAELGKSIRFLGWLPRRDVGAYLAAADIGLSYFSDHWIFRTNSPTKVMEYLAAGLPVVCSDQPEQRLLVEQCSGGEIVQNDAPDEYADAMHRCVSRQTDRSAISERFVALRGYDVHTARLEQALLELP